MVKETGKRVFKATIEPFRRFINVESSAGIVLFAMTILALLWANSPWSETYFEILNTKFSVGIGDWAISKSLLIWINDALMAVFFFVVGLEIKREVMAGELSTMKKAALPIAAAAGGMILPVSIFFILNQGGEGMEGWGITMATDIAFTLGILKLIGNRVPLSLKVLLTAFAIVDDIGAIVVIAIFYSGSIPISLMAIAAGLYFILIIFNFFDVRHPVLYLIIGIALWYVFLLAHIHPTLAGVLAAFTIPITRKIDLPLFLDRMNSGLQQFSSIRLPGAHVMTNEQLSSLDYLERSIEEVRSPLQKLEHSLHEVVLYVVMPVFALANAGVVIGSDFFQILASPLTIQIMLGLLLGKLFGIAIFSWLAVKLGLAQLPDDLQWTHIIGVGFLGAVGFTMALFISNLAFTQGGQEELLNQAKVGILVCSFVAGLIGYIWLSRTLKKPADVE
ncbi:MAG: Na+/H+ antiporter NhaA [Bacteroidia bacterium]